MDQELSGVASARASAAADRGGGRCRDGEKLDNLDDIHSFFLPSFSDVIGKASRIDPGEDERDVM